MSKGTRNRKKRTKEKSIPWLERGLQLLSQKQLRSEARVATLKAKVATKEAEIAKAKADA